MWTGKDFPFQVWPNCFSFLQSHCLPVQLPRFFQLCSDNVWGVRKACAECFMTVSSATSQEVRRTKLSSLFINLISDPSRWVRDFPLPWATALRMFVCVDKWDFPPLLWNLGQDYCLQMCEAHGCVFMMNSSLS